MPGKVTVKIYCDGCEQIIKDVADKTPEKCRRIIFQIENDAHVKGKWFHLCHHCSNLVRGALQKDELAKFGAFAERYIARRGEVSEEELKALFEDFQGIELRKDEPQKDRGRRLGSNRPSRRSR